MEKIQIRSNVKEYQITDENDNELGVIRIDTTDFGFYNRTEEAGKRINEILKRFEAMCKTDMTTEQRFEKLAEFDKEVKAELNKMFDYDVSSVVFGNKNCLSFGNGELFIKRFLGAVIPIIKKDVEKEQKITKQKMAKYTKRYIK